jgi:hypothetical protein
MAMRLESFCTLSGPTPEFIGVVEIGQVRAARRELVSAKLAPLGMVTGGAKSS